MGTFRCTVEISNIHRDLVETVEVLVGTGCSHSLFPRSLLTRLGIVEKRRVKFERPDGTIVEMGMGEARIRIEDRQAPTNVVFNDDDEPASLGKVTLSGLCMKIDPEQNRLVKYLPRMKPPGWYEHQRKLKEAIESIEAERRNAANQEREV